MKSQESLKHTRFYCKYHVVFIPKYAVSSVVSFIKGKSAIYNARVYSGRQKSFTGHSFWARGYFVSTVWGRTRQSSVTTSVTKNTKTSDSTS